MCAIYVFLWPSLISFVTFLKNELYFYLQYASVKFSEGWKVATNVLSRDRVTTDGVWIGNWIYWNLTERNCK
jgi:hypothetical protein